MSTPMTSSPPTVRATAAPKAEPATPSLGSPKGPLIAVQATSTLITFTTLITTIAVRVSPAPLRQALPTHITDCRVNERAVIRRKRAP